MTSMPAWPRRIRPFIANDLPRDAGRHALFAAVIGESPSRYSRSPAMWSAAFAVLGIDAVYLPLDVPARHVASLLAALRDEPAFAGCNVTVPYKLDVMASLDTVDEAARRIGAVNTIVRGADGALSGHNTDADGLMQSLVRPMPGAPKPFLASLAGLDTLLIGAGGAARAAAFALSKAIGDASLTICNRSIEKARDLADEASADAIGLDELDRVIHEMDLVINASTVGQSGMRAAGDDFVTTLEPFSSLAPADSVDLRASSFADEREFHELWRAANEASVRRNRLTSMEVLRRAKPSAAFVDLIYSPPETTMLRLAREAGRPVLNGRGMLIMQAVEAFARRVMRRHIEAASVEPAAAYDRVLAAMAGAW
ncbi:MAG: hypothetical protein FJ318_08420 [SAR202 cluster bacterium]|nr:hypothetical protein [SAR202 cluster bacterium]